MIILKVRNMALVALSLLTISLQSAIAANQETISKAASALKMRSIGPALMGGRIADIAIHADKKSTWYVAVGSGGVWKTLNAGITGQQCLITRVLTPLVT